MTSHLTFKNAGKKILGLILLNSLAATSAAVKAGPIDPIGDEKFGYLEVPKPPNGTIPYEIKYRGVAVPTGGRTERLKPGSGCIDYSTSFSLGTFNAQFCGVDIKAEQTTRFDLFSRLAGVRLGEVSIPKDVDLPPYLKIAMNYLLPTGPTPLPFEKYQDSHGQIAYISPGIWTLEFSRAYTPVKFTLSAGTISDFSVKLPDQRAHIVLEPPKNLLPQPREYREISPKYAALQFPYLSIEALRKPPYHHRPTPPNYPGPQNPPGYTFHLDMAIESEKKVFPAQFLGHTEQKTVLKVFPLNPATEGSYAFSINQSRKVFALAPGETKTLHWQRLEVADPRVKREDGTVYTAKGIYTALVFDVPTQAYVGVRPMINSVRGTAPQYVFPTPSGIDVLAGNLYKVVVEFNTLIGPERREFLIDYRNENQIYESETIQ